MRGSLLALGAAIVLFSLAPGVLAQSAQGSVRLSTLEISLWPEFDKRELLVIFQGRLADGVPLPAVLTLSMPKEAGEPHAVASVDEADQRLTAAYELQEVGEETRVTYTSLQNLGFQFEYYWDALEIDGQTRTFTFSFTLDFPVDDFNLELQQPFDATNVTLSPPAMETTVGFGNLTYHQRPLGAVEAGRTVTWQVSYDKASDQLTASTLPTPVPAVATPTAGTSSADSQAGLIVAVGIGVVAAVALMLFFSNRRQSAPQQRYVQAPPSKRKRRKVAPSSQAQPPTRQERAAPNAPSGASSQTGLPEGGFCHRCGAALPPDALFCHRCGTPRKGI